MSPDVTLGLDALSRGKSVAIVKSGAVLAGAAGGGIRPFLDAVDAAGPAALGATLVDRVVGRAVALLAIHAGIRRVHACVISRPALEVLATASVTTTYDRVVDHILNRDGNDMCPIEKMAGSFGSPAEANEKLRSLMGLG